MSVIVDTVIRPVIEWVHGTAQDATEFVFDEILEPVVFFLGDTIAALADDPIATVAKAVAIATNTAYLIPLIDGASAAASGEDIGDVLKAVAVSYVAQAIGGEVAQHTAPYVDEVIGEALSEGVKAVAVQAITQGTVAATQAIIYGEDPLKAFARGGLTAAVSAGLGQIGEQLGWEVEITNPDTGQRTTQAIPNVVQNMIGASITAELTGQEITPELMATALTRGLITTQLVRDYIVTNPDIGDKEIGFITAAFQRTAAIALSGGTGEEAAAQLMGVLSAYGMTELHDQIENSGFGDFIGNTLDRISGDYQAVAELADQIDVVGPRLGSNYAEFKEKYDALKTRWEALNEAKERAQELSREVAEAGDSPWLQMEAAKNMEAVIAEAEADVKAALAEYNDLVELGYEDDINRLIPLIEEDHALFNTLEEDIIAAQNNLQISTSTRLAPEGQLREYPIRGEAMRICC